MSNMAAEKYIRVDGRKSSYYCLTITMVVFVSFCSIEVWKFMSSTIFIVQNSNLQPQATYEKELGNTIENQEEKVLSGRTSEFENGVTDNERSNYEKETSDKPGMFDNKTSNQVLPTSDFPKLNTPTEALATQATGSDKEKGTPEFSNFSGQIDYKWKLCNTTAGPDYIPCLDNWQALHRLPSINHYEHLERHCPDQAPTCLVPIPAGYKIPILWPESREKIWYSNIPHSKLVEAKKRQNWVKLAGDYFTFPGGGTQFSHGAPYYIDFLQMDYPSIAWGRRTRVVLDVGCGVASFGGYLFEKDVLTMSFAPKDTHEAQVQFALERGIPAILGVMGTKRLPFPSGVFDLVHCARCRVSWHGDGGKLLLELNRVLRPGGFFVWSATPVYQKLQKDIDIWKAMTKLTKSICWDLVAIRKDKVNGKAAAIYRKPTSNKCYNRRPQNEPLLCKKTDDPSASWNVPLQACIHKVPVNASKRGSRWPEQWPSRLQKLPYWLNSRIGVYGKAARDEYVADCEHWKQIVVQLYLNGIGISWSSVRNVMDMRAVYGGFAAALKDLKVWVMNVVPVDAPDTLPIIYDRGLFGIYHDWCESFNTYPRTYDLLHADRLFSSVKRRCNLMAVFAEVDRILRPEGKLIIRDSFDTISEVTSITKSLQWEIRFSQSQNNEGLLYVQKTLWRPTETQTIISAIA